MSSCHPTDRTAVVAAASPTPKPPMVRTFDVQSDYIARCEADAAEEQATLDSTPELRALAEKYRRERGKAYQQAMRERLTSNHNR